MFTTPGKIKENHNMFFENFHEEIGTFDSSIIEDFKKKLFNIDLSDPALARQEYCFKDGGKLILPLHFAVVRNQEYFDYVKPLIELAQQTQHPCLNNTHPFRIEISILEPGKSVLWHHDQHIFHKFSERIHFPIVTSDNVEFLAKWFTDKKAYKFKMEPGKIYRFNNRSLHSVKNNNDVFRCHVMIDFIHKNVLHYFMKENKVENLKNNVTITPADELWYFINQNPKKCVEAQLSDDDIEQLKNLARY